MSVGELIARLQGLPSDLPVILNFDRIGVSPAEDVVPMGSVSTVVQTGGFVQVDPGQGALECHIVARVPESWGRR